MHTLTHFLYKRESKAEKVERRTHRTSNASEDGHNKSQGSAASPPAQQPTGSGGSKSGGENAWKSRAPITVSSDGQERVSGGEASFQYISNVRHGVIFFDFDGTWAGEGGIKNGPKIKID